MKYEEDFERIALYLSGRMEPDEQAAFESRVNASTDLQREIEDLRPVFGAINAEFSAARQTRFALSAARRAELRRDSSANVISFPGGREVGSRGRKRLAFGHASAWVGIAAAVLLIAFIGLEDSWQASVVGDLSSHASSAGPSSDAKLGQQEGVYVYHPGYGLDVTDAWPAQVGRESVEVDWVSSDRPVSLEGLGLFRHMDEWRPAYLGLEGSRRYHDALTLRSPGAI